MNDFTELVKKNAIQAQANETLVEHVEILSEIIEEQSFREQLPPEKINEIDCVVQKTEKIKENLRSGDELRIEDVEKALKLHNDKSAVTTNKQSFFSSLAVATPLFLFLLTIGLVNIFKPQIGLSSGLIIALIGGISAFVASLAIVKSKVS